MLPNSKAVRNAAAETELDDEGTLGSAGGGASLELFEDKVPRLLALLPPQPTSFARPRPICILNIVSTALLAALRRSRRPRRNGRKRRRTTMICRSSLGRRSRWPPHLPMALTWTTRTKFRPRTRQWWRKRSRTYRLDHMSPFVAHPILSTGVDHAPRRTPQELMPGIAAIVDATDEKAQHHAYHPPLVSYAPSTPASAPHRSPLPYLDAPSLIPWHLSPRDVLRRMRSRPRRPSSWTTTLPTWVEVALTQSRSRTSRLHHRRQRCTPTCMIPEPLHHHTHCRRRCTRTCAPCTFELLAPLLN